MGFHDKDSIIGRMIIPMIENISQAAAGYKDWLFNFVNYSMFVWLRGGGWR